MVEMQDSKHITIFSEKKKTVLGISTILYVQKSGNHVEIHISGGRIYKTRLTLEALAEKLGDGFIRVHRGCMVSVMAIHFSKKWNYLLQ